MTFDPEGTFGENSSLFGLPKDMEEASLKILPIAWEVTTSFRRGTSQGPSAIFEASKQMDLYHPYWRKTYEKGIHWDATCLEKSLTLNNEFSPQAQKIISLLESNGEVSSDLFNYVNEGSNKLNDFVYNSSINALTQNYTPALVGGDHSTPYGLIQALTEKYKGDFTIVHFDAHFDLRDAYQGFTHSHASIMKNVLDLPSTPKILQLGLRDFSESEILMAQEKTQFLLDLEFQQMKSKGTALNDIFKTTFQGLSENIYVSFDIDGLTPEFCPSTGTPVPGGFTFSEATAALRHFNETGHKLIGFDLVETSPNPTEKSIGLDEIFASRLLYELSCFALSSR